MFVSGTRYFIVKSFTASNVNAALRDVSKNSVSTLKTVLASFASKHLLTFTDLKCIWATQPKNIQVFTKAFNTCRHVVLVFSVNGSRAFQGYCRMSSLPSSDILVPEWQSRLLWPSTDPFRIEWVTVADTEFHHVAHLRNGLNDGQPVLIGRDGQEIEPDCGRALCEVIDDQERSRHSNEH